VSVQTKTYIVIQFVKSVFNPFWQGVLSFFSWLEKYFYPIPIAAIFIVVGFGLFFTFSIATGADGIMWVKTKIYTAVQSVKSIFNSFWQWILSRLAWLDKYFYALTIIAIFVVVVAGLYFTLLKPTFFLERAIDSELASQKILIYPHHIDLNSYLIRYKDFQFGFLTVMGGVIGVLTLLLGLKRFEQTQTEHRNIRFKDAIELLGNDKMDVRLGAIYSLEQLMKEKPDDFAVRVVNILAAYVANRGAQVTAAFNGRLKITETNLSDGEALNNENNWDVLKKIVAREYYFGEVKTKLISVNCFDEDVSVEKIPSQPPYTDIITALKILGSRFKLNLPDIIENQIDFNLPHIDFSLFPISPFTLYQVYTGEEKKVKKQRSNKVYNKSFMFADCKEADFSDIQFNGADFTGAELYETNFSNSSLQWVNFSSATLTRTNFNNVKFEGVIFTKTDLCSVNFHEARSLFWVNFTDAKLERVNFSGLDLMQINLSNVEFGRFNSLAVNNFRSTDIRGVNLRGVIWKKEHYPNSPSNKNDPRLIWDDDTIWPDGQRRDQQGHLIPTPPAEPLDNNDTPQV
jgi:hypothetical protein